MDKSAIVWNAQSGELLQQVKFHDEPLLDVDWRNNEQYATCSTDRAICVCQVSMCSITTVRTLTNFAFLLICFLFFGRGVVGGFGFYVCI